MDYCRSLVRETRKGIEMTPEKAIENALLNWVDDNSVPEPNTGCFLWTGCTDRHGYGRTGQKSELVHRMIYKKLNAIDIKGLVVRHKCDTPACINPDHLIHGTQMQNMRDKVNRGRNRNGRENISHCKFGHEFNELNIRVTKGGARQCIKCCSARAKKWRMENKPIRRDSDRIREKKWRENNPEKARAYSREWARKKRLELKNGNT